MREVPPWSSRRLVTMPGALSPERVRGEEGSLRTGSVLYRILVDLLKLNVAPLAVFQMLKSMCAGQRLASEPQDPAAVSLSTSSVSETRGQSWARCSSPLWLGRWGGRGGEVGRATHSLDVAASDQTFLWLWVFSQDLLGPHRSFLLGLLSPAWASLKPLRAQVQNGWTQSGRLSLAHAG